MNAVWLYAIEEPVGDWTPGDVGDYWVDARVDRRGDLIRRADGLGAGEPRWRVGDDVLIYHPSSGRFIAHERVESDPDWNESEWRWDFALKVIDFAWDGPSAASLGVRITQGARKQLPRSVLAAARAALAKASS
jgi:hypothetical protein